MKLDELTSEEIKNAAKMLGIKTGRKSDKRLVEEIELELAKFNDGITGIEPDLVIIDESNSDLDELEEEEIIIPAKARVGMQVDRVSTLSPTRRGKHPITGKQL